MNIQEEQTEWSGNHEHRRGVFVPSAGRGAALLFVLSVSLTDRTIRGPKPPASAGPGGPLLTCPAPPQKD